MSRLAQAFLNRLVYDRSKTGHSHAAWKGPLQRVIYSRRFRALPARRSRVVKLSKTSTCLWRVRHSLQERGCRSEVAMDGRASPSPSQFSCRIAGNESHCAGFSGSTQLIGHSNLRRSNFTCVAAQGRSASDTTWRNPPVEPLSGGGGSSLPGNGRRRFQCCLRRVAVFGECWVFFESHKGDQRWV